MKGKKYPQPVDTYIGVITPEGVIQSNKRKVSLTDAEVWEYGFSKAVWELCPDDWKKPLGDDWQDVLSIILLKQSPTSYIQKTRVMKKNRISDISLQPRQRPCPAEFIKTGHWPGRITSVRDHLFSMPG